MKLGRLIIDIAGLELSAEDEDILKHPSVGGVILFARNFDNINQVHNLINRIKSLRSPSLVVYVDQEGERVQRFKKGLSLLPSVDILGIKFSLDNYGACELSEQLGWLISFELKCLGIDVNTAPVLDIDYGNSEIMKKRCFSSNPKIVSKLAKAFLRGSRKTGLASVCKHYPGHGYAKTDSHKELPVDNRDYRTIFRNDIFPYKMAIDFEIEGIMTSHVLYKNFDIFPPTLSQKWLHILKNELRYKGLIYSDDLSMNALNEFGNMQQNVKNSIKAGCDCLFICNNREQVIKTLDEVIINQTMITNNKLINLSSKKNSFNIKDILTNKKRRSILEEINKIEEKKQIEINLGS